jgi:hypothetical protein
MALKMQKESALRSQYDCGINWGHHILRGRPCLENIMLWLRYHYEDKAEAPATLHFLHLNVRSMVRKRKSTGDDGRIDAMFRIAHTMRGGPWERVEYAANILACTLEDQYDEDEDEDEDDSDEVWWSDTY